MTNLYLVRHCQAISNEIRVYHGHKNCDVTAIGRRQLECLSERFKDIKFDKIYTSPLLRATRTADAVNKYHGQILNVDNDVIEINGGDHEGHPWDELDVTDPVQMHYWKHEPEFYAPKNGEKMTELWDRAFPAIKRIAMENKDKTIVVTSHACFIRSAIVRAKGLEITDLKKFGWSDNTSVSLLQFDDDFNCTVVFESDNSHLTDDIKNLALKYHKNGKADP